MSCVPVAEKEPAGTVFLGQHMLSLGCMFSPNPTGVSKLTRT